MHRVLYWVNTQLKGTPCDTAGPRTRSASPLLVPRGSSCTKAEHSFPQSPPGLSPHGVTHESPDTQQIKSFLTELCPGPVCCWGQLDWRKEPISTWPKNKSEIVPIPLLNIVLVSMRGFVCFFSVGICLNPLAKWLWNSRGLKGSTGKPPDWIKYFKPRGQGKIVISNWKSPRLWQ